jgi:S1-C subfamily serine protease
MPISMPSAPPYLPSQEPPWIDQPPPPPPAPPEPPRRPRRGRAAAIIVALSLLCGGLGLEIGSTFFGSPATTSTAATSTANTATLPTVGSTPATGGTTGGMSAADIAAKVDPAVVNITTTLANGHAAGTGMILTSDGLVLTNNHVIADATAIRAQINGSGPIYSATVLGYDISEDVALLQIDGASNLPTISVGDSSRVALHDKVVALGNALGKGGTPAIAEGSVTALDQSITAGDPGGPAQALTGLIEINAPLVPGDSGGPLVNMSGQVIGMNAAAAPQTRRQSSSDAFAIPINAALDIARQIQSGQSSAKVHVGARALLGVQVQQGQGATVAVVQPGGPAESAGLAPGDVIVSVGGKTITSLSDLPSALDSYHPGDKVSIGWIGTNGQHHTATVQLIAGPPA